MDRILLYEIGGGDGVKQYATFDPNHLGDNLELELSNLAAVHTADGDDLYRSALSTIGVTSGHHFVECVFYGTGQSKGSDLVTVGVTPTLDVATAFIGTGGSYGYAPESGSIYLDEASIATVATSEDGQFIGVELNLDASPPYVAWWVNGALIATQTIDVGSAGPWYFGLSVGGDTAFDRRGFINFGQRAFEYSVPDGARSGLYTETTSPAVVRIATETFTTSPEDSPANTIYAGRLGESFDTTIDRRVSQWTWGRSGGESAAGDIEILNGDGAYDTLLSDAYRDQPVIARLVERDGSLSSAEVFHTAIVEEIVAEGENIIRVKQRDKLSKLDVAFQRRLFPPSVSDNAANQPVPVSLGTVRNIAPVLYDEGTLAYRVSDQPVNSIIVVRDKGDPLLPGEAGSPTVDGDWSYTDRQDGFVLANDPQGKVSADVSSTGGSGVDPTPDALAGVGDPFVWLNPLSLSGWGDVSYNLVDGSGGTHTVSEATGGGIRLTRSLSGNPGVVAYAGALSVLTPGQSYRYRIAVSEFNDGGSSSVTVNIATGSASGNTRYAQLRGVGDFTGIFVAETDDVYITLSFDTITKAVSVSSFTVEQVTAVDPADYDDPVAGITLPDFAEEVIERRALLSSSDWSRASATAVDANGYDCGVYITEQTTCRDVLDRIMASYAGWYFQDREGLIRFGRLFDPEVGEGSPTAAPAFSFTEDDVIGDLRVSLDRAEGLSTSIACRRNWSPFGDSDFVEDFVDVPANLRARFSRAFQFTRTSSANLAEPYTHARLAQANESLIDDPDDGQVEIDRVGELYEDQRRFHRFTVGITAANEFTVEPGDVVRLTFPRFGLDDGRLLLVVGVRVAFFDGTVELNCWG